MKLQNELFLIKDKVALVTGGYRGIGRIFAETYAAMGAKVVISARDGARCSEAAAEISRKYNANVIGKAIDVSDSAIVSSVVSEIQSEFGRIDILVNNAGIPGVEKPVLEMSEQDLDRVMAVNFRGVFLVSKAVGKVMVAQGGGKIINVASIAGKIAARRMGDYCVSKAAVIQLTRVMALELVRYNVQVNALCPGYFLTDMNRSFFESEKGKQFIQRMIPIGRLGDLSELRSTALYLATCPPFMTGAEIYIDGGHSIM